MAQLPLRLSVNFAQVVRRITAILLMGHALNKTYAAIFPTEVGLPKEEPDVSRPN